MRAITVFPTRAAIALLFLFVAACAERTAPHAVLRGETMGTWYSVTVVGRLTEGEQTALHTEIERLLQIVNGIASTYDPDSELSVLNGAPVQQWLDISTPLYDMLMMSQEISWLTGGAWDPTVGPLVDLWGFGPGNTGRTAAVVPAPETIVAAMSGVGFQQLQLDLLQPRLIKKAPVEIDLSGIAKGYAVDEISAWLKHRGYNDHLVEVGGEIRVHGNSPRGDRWRIAVESPDAARGAAGAIRLDNVAVATSGDYRNFFEVDGKRYSHTIDPRSGRPVSHTLASVTVVAATCSYADAMATALNVLGPDAGMALAERHAIAVMLVVRSAGGYETIHSPAFEPYLQ